MITIHWLWLVALVGVGVYIGLLGAAALQANDWQEKEETEEEKYKPPEINLAEVVQKAGVYLLPDINGTIEWDGTGYILTEGECKLKVNELGLWYHNEDGTWQRVISADTEGEK